MPTVLAFPRRRPAPPAPAGGRPAARDPRTASAAPVAIRRAPGSRLDLLAAACLGLLPAEARLEALLDRIEARP